MGHPANITKKSCKDCPFLEYIDVRCGDFGLEKCNNPEYCDGNYDKMMIRKARKKLRSSEL